MRLRVGIGWAQAVAKGTGGPAPEWIRLLPAPTFTIDGSGDGDLTLLVDELAKQLVLDDFARRGNDLVFDYEHQTLSGGQAPAAGWIKELEARDDGVWGRVEWTTDAAAMIERGEYRYFSPVFDYDPQTLRVTRLHHCALTNWPRTHDQTSLTEQLAAKARAKYGEREEGMKTFLEKLKSALGAKLTAAKAELAALVEALPDDVTAAAKAESLDLEATLAGLAGYALVPSSGALAAKAVLEVLGLPEAASLAQVQAKVIQLKSPPDMVAKADHDKVVKELEETRTALAKATAQTAEQRLEQLIVANRAKLPPAKEREVRAIAKAQGVEQAEKVVELLDPVLPETDEQVKNAPVAPAPETVATSRTVRGAELAVDPESAMIAAKVEAHMQASGGKLTSYAAAYEDLKTKGGLHSA